MTDWMLTSRYALRNMPKELETQTGKYATIRDGSEFAGIKMKLDCGSPSTSIITSARPAGRDTGSRKYRRSLLTWARRNCSPFRRRNSLTVVEYPPLLTPEEDFVMDPLDADIVLRSQDYARKYSVILDRRLGFGRDGTVWQTVRRTALKVFGRADAFERKLAVYERLQENGVTEINGHQVPLLIRHDSQPSRDRDVRRRAPLRSRFRQRPSRR